MCSEKKKCQKPEELKGTPGACSPEQIKKCHGDVVGHPCVETLDCEQPKKPEGKRGKCSPEQVRECHGDAGDQPCADNSGKKKQQGYRL